MDFIINLSISMTTSLLNVFKNWIINDTELITFGLNIFLSYQNQCKQVFEWQIQKFYSQTSAFTILPGGLSMIHCFSQLYTLGRRLPSSADFLAKAVNQSTYDQAIRQNGES